jgi:hypothetical protein
MIKMKTIYTSLLLAFLYQLAPAQHLAAWLDYIDRFLVFDHGRTSQLEHYKVTSFEVGGLCIMYVDYSHNLKVYYDGKVIKLEDMAPTEYTATDYLAGYSVYNVLKIFEEGQQKVICSNVEQYVVEDSLVVYYDRAQQRLEAYHDGTTVILEDGLLQWPLRSYRSGDNIFAYITSFDDKFKIWYHGQLMVINEFVRETVYKAGRDIVAYINQPTNAFVAFYKGDFYMLEPFMPRSFEVGDEFMAYVDINGAFKIFEGGDLKVISSYPPDFYQVTDSTLVFGEDGFLKTWCDGQVYEVERYIPELYRVSERTIAYTDVNRRIKAFSKCERINISYEMVNSLDMIRNLIIYNMGVNTTKIWYNGKVY